MIAPLGFRKNTWRTFVKMGVTCIVMVTLILYMKTLENFVLSSFSLRNLNVEGRDKTSREDLLQAVQMSLGDSLFKHDLHKIQERLHTCPFVRTSIIKRELPSTLRIFLLERTPVAIWVDQGTEKLIDDEGHPIMVEDIQQFANLLHIVGKDAPYHVKAFQKIWATIASKVPGIRKAIFLRSHRWDIFLENGILLKLPETDLQRAVQKLPGLLDSLQDQPIKSIDLRFPDATLIEKTS